MSKAKITPQNLDAEKSVLGAILVDSEVISDVVQIVRPEDFYDKRHQVIFKAMLKLFSKNAPIDILTINDQLKKHDDLSKAGGASYLADITNSIATAAHSEAYAKLITEAAIKRKLIKASSEIAELGYKDDVIIDELLGKAEKEIFSVSEKTASGDLVAIENILADSFERIEELQKNKGALRGITTGYRDLDHKTAGLQKSDLIILAARPAMGKTTLVTNLAYNVASISKKPVLFFSLEMSKEQLVDRMLADSSGVDAWKIRTGNLTSEDFSKMSEAMGEMSETPILIDDTPGLNVLELRTKARRAAHNKELGLIIIDYLQLMQPVGKSDGNRVQEVSEISRGLKLVARELNVPVIALSQLSRSVENRNPKIPQLADLRESGSIEQDADMVMFIYRDAYYNEDSEKGNITDLIIAKHRNGPTGTIELYFHPERLRFMSVDKERDE